LLGCVLAQGNTAGGFAADWDFTCRMHEDRALRCPIAPTAFRYNRTPSHLIAFLFMVSSGFTAAFVLSDGKVI